MNRILIGLGALTFPLAMWAQGRRRDTAVKLHRLGGEDQRTVNSTSPKSVEYFEGVTGVDVQDSVYGPFTLNTFIQRLQLEVHAPCERRRF